MTLEELKRIKSMVETGLTIQDITNVVETFNTSDDAAIRYKALDIIGWGRFTEYISTVRAAFYQTDDIQLTCLATTTLVRYFNNIKEDLDTYKKYLRGIEDDYAENLKFDALYASGLAYYETRDVSILRCIVEAAEGDSIIERKVAYDAMAEALASDPYYMLPHELDQLKSPDLREANLAEVKRLIHSASL